MSQALIVDNTINEFQKVVEIGQYLIKITLPCFIFHNYLFEIISYASTELGYYNESLKINKVILQPSLKN